MNMHQLLELTVTRSASDLHLLADYPPLLRINGDLVPVSGESELTSEQVGELIFSIISVYQKDMFLKNWELDLGIDVNGARFRVNLYYQRGAPAAALRLIPKEIRTLEQTGLPSNLAHLTELRQGLVLVTGPTGHGKSTTLASFINQINLNRSSHIITIEDPIEFIYPKAKALISQRELNSDTKTWGNALKSTLREDPDVVLVGEMRDLDTIATTMTIAETGHLVFATLHTNSAAQTIDRIIDVFPQNQQNQIRMQLSSVIEAIISLRLIPTISPGRTLASEILLGTAAARSIIRDGKTHLMDNLIQTSAEEGMETLETSLASLVREGKITIDVAQSYALRPALLSKLLGVTYYNPSNQK